MKNIDSILIAIMFREPLPESFSFFNLTGSFKKEFNNLFEKVEPIAIIPGGQLAPPEVPRYILKSEEETICEFTFSGLRFDFRFVNIKNFKPNWIEDNLKSIQTVLNTFNLKPFRIGIVPSGKIILDNNEFFLEQYIKMEDFSNSKEIHYSYRNTIDKEGYNLNEWVKYGALNRSNITDFELDINTMDSISLDMITDFSQTVSKKIGDFIEH